MTDINAASTITLESLRKRDEKMCKADITPFRFNTHEEFLEARKAWDKGERDRKIAQNVLDHLNGPPR